MKESYTFTTFKTLRNLNIIKYQASVTCELRE